MKKIQAFVVLGFVLCFVLAIGFFMEKESIRAEKTVLTNQLGHVMGAKKVLEASISHKEKTINYLLAKLEKSESIRKRLSNNLERTNLRMAQYQNEINLEKIVVSSLNDVEGKVLAVDKLNDLIVVSLGANDNIKVGTRFSVYRGSDVIAKAELVKVEKNVSAAAILGNEDKNINIEVNDKIKL